MTDSIDIHNLHNAKTVVTAAFLGGMISIPFMVGLSLMQRVSAIVSGMVMAYYLAPLIAFLFAEGNYVSPIAFLIGLFGMSIAGAIFKAITKSDIWALIEKRFSREAE